MGAIIILTLPSLLPILTLLYLLSFLDRCALPFTRRYANVLNDVRVIPKHEYRECQVGSRQDRKVTRLTIPLHVDSMGWPKYFIVERPVINN